MKSEDEKQADVSASVDEAATDVSAPVKSKERPRASVLAIIAFFFSFAALILVALMSYYQTLQITKYDSLRLLIVDQGQKLAEVHNQVAWRKDIRELLLAHYAKVFDGNPEHCEQIKNILVATSDNSSLEVMENLADLQKDSQCGEVWIKGREKVAKLLGIQILIFYSSGQGERARNLHSKLHELGYPVALLQPDTDNSAKTPKTSEVRYFAHWEASVARLIANRLSAEMDQGKGLFSAVDASRTPDRQIVPPWYFELWVGDK
jgi:hypothetical protein